MNLGERIRRSFELTEDREALEQEPWEQPWEERGESWSHELSRRVEEALAPPDIERVAILRRESRTSHGYRTRYLTSPEWRRTREGAILAAGKQCTECGARNVTLDVHHLTYERLGHEEPADLVVLCRPCHQTKHYEGAE